LTVFKNCTFNGTESASIAGTFAVGLPSTYFPWGFNSINHNNSGFNRFYANIGRIDTDSTYFYDSRLSTRLTPTSSTFKLRTNTFRVPTNSGQSCNVIVWVRKSTTSDGSNYNGSQPRLVLQYNPFIGGTGDLVVASGTTSNGIWERLAYSSPALSSRTIYEFYVDCDGTVGWINVDDWRTTTYNNSKGGAYWSLMGQYTEPDFRQPGGNYTFIT
jgi:hypothetical protein